MIVYDRKEPVLALSFIHFFLCILKFPSPYVSNEWLGLGERKKKVSIAFDLYHYQINVTARACSAKMGSCSDSDLAYAGHPMVAKIS